MDWTEQQIAELTRLWNEDRSARDISNALDISRNAVIGKARRLNLKRRPSPIRTGGASGRRAGAESGSGTRAAAKRAARTQRHAASRTDDHAKKSAPKSGTPQCRDPENGATHQATTDERHPRPQDAAPPDAASAHAEHAPEAVEAQPRRADPAEDRQVPDDAPRAAADGSAGSTRRRPLPSRDDRTAPTDARRPCAWPIGDPGDEDFHFCGAEAEPGRPYCADHEARAHTKAKSTLSAP